MAEEFNFKKERKELIHLFKTSAMGVTSFTNGIKEQDKKLIKQLKEFKFKDNQTGKEDYLIIPIKDFDKLTK